MGWFQRLFSGAPDQDGLNRGHRSPDQARVSAEDLVQELRALHKEIKLLRESLGGGGRDVLQESQEGSRNRRGRSRGRGGGGREREREGDRDRDYGRNRGRGRESGPRRSLPRVIPDDAPVGPLVDYLKTRGVVVYEGQDDLNRNEAFEHLARHLGTHFDLLAEFYEKVKRCVATGRGQRIDIDGYTQAQRSAAVQFGTLLHRHGMLKDFYYHRSPKRQLRVIPTKDGQIGQFLTGGWLEIYVSSVLAKRLKAAMSPAKFQLLYNVKGMLPDGREFEADLMAAVEDKFFWLECKTGNWQDYSARFRGLVKIFGVDRTSGGLLLIRPPDAATRARATDMLDMTLLSLADVDDFISVFLGEEPTGDSRRLAPAPSLEGIPEEEKPLADAPPARKLGAVALDDLPDAAPGLRRRRRRRGGRGRGRGARSATGAATASAASAAPASAQKGETKDEPKKAERPKQGRLLEPVPMTRLDDEEKGAKDASTPAVKTDAGEAEAAAPVRRRRRRRSTAAPSPFAETKAEEAKPSSKPAAAKEKEEPKAESKPETQAVAQPKKSPTGVTIAPDLGAMMAGSQKDSAKSKES